MAGEKIEQSAHQDRAAPLVMGAHGRAGMGEWLFGAARRYALRHSTLPVLLAH